jgi:flagellar hook-basal body complex protein FliE
MSDFARISEKYWAGNGFALPEKPAPAPGAGFGEMLKTSLDEVGRLQATADRAVEDLSAGRGGDLHATMIAVEKAGIAFELTMQIRNKLLAAYENIMRTQV